MNERLQKWLENHLVRSEYTEFGWQECHRYEFDEHELEKFAELIVRESIVDFYRNYLDTTSDDDITEQVDRYVKQNFGVE